MSGKDKTDEFIIHQKEQMEEFLEAVKNDIMKSNKLFLIQKMNLQFHLNPKNNDGTTENK